MKIMKSSLLFILSAISLILIQTQESKALGAGDFFDIIDDIRDHRDGHRPPPPDRPFLVVLVVLPMTWNVAL
ncbi:MAG: hypothetical protein IPK68_11780 [Bdellovibrionales bacterium]|nr:hypothetical protein [Bdellovibrionales bacterium]